MATAALAKSHERAMRASPAELAAYLQDLFGQKLVALIAGVDDPKAIGAWARGKRRPQPEAERRLRAAVQIAELLLQYEAPQTVRAWFVGMNPYLDDRSPTLVIA